MKLLSLWMGFLSMGAIAAAAYGETIQKSLIRLIEPSFISYMPNTLIEL